MAQDGLVVDERIDHVGEGRGGLALEGGVPQLLGVDGAVDLVAADVPHHELGHRVEGQLRRLGHQHVALSHEEVRGVHRLEDVLVAEGGDPARAVPVQGGGPGLEARVVVKIGLDLLLQLRHLLLEHVPHGEMVAEVDPQLRLARLDVGQQVPRHGQVQIPAGPRAAHGHEEADGLAAVQPRHAHGAVVLHALHQLGVDVVAHVEEVPVGHGLEGGLRHAVELLVAQIGKGRLDRMDGSLGQMEPHGPVVRDGVHHVGEARVDRALAGPHMGAHIGHVLGKVPEQRHQQLRVLLVAGVVGDLPKALAVQRFPVELVEEADLLAELGPQGVEVVLVPDHLGPGGVEGGKVKPDGLAAQGLRAGGDGHGDAVVAEAHADVAHDQGVFREIQRRVAEHQVLDAQLRDLVDGLQAQVIHLLGVVPKLLQKPGLGLLGLGEGLGVDGIAEDHAALIHGSPLFLGVVGDGLHDLLLVIGGQDDGAQHAEAHRHDGHDPKADGGGGKVVALEILGGAEDRERGEHQHGHGLAELHGEGPGGEEHALPLLAGEDGVLLGHVSHDGLGDDAEERHGESRNDDDQRPGQDAREPRHHAGEGRHHVGEGQAQEAADDQLLLAELHDQLGYHGVEAGGEDRHAAQEHGGVELIEAHAYLHEEGQACLKQGEADPVGDIGGSELQKVLVLEGLAQTLDGVAVAGHRVHKVLLVELEHGDQEAHEGDSCQHDEPDPIAPGVGDHLLQGACEHEGQIGDEGAEKEGQRDGRGDVHAVFLGLAELRDEGVVGSAVHGHEEVEEDEGAEDPGDVHAADALHGSEKHQHGDDGEGDGGPLHEGDPAALGVGAAVGKGGDPGVGNRIEDTADEGDEAQHRQNPKDHQARGHVELGAGGHGAAGGQIEGDQPGVDDAA